MRLADLVTLLTSLSVSPAVSDLAVEDAVRAAFLSAVDPAGLQFRSLSTALKSVLLTCLLLGESEYQSQDVAPILEGMLSQVGANVVWGDLQLLTRDLSGLLSVHEAVHGTVYSVMLDPLVQMASPVSSDSALEQ